LTHEGEEIMAHFQVYETSLILAGSF